MLLAGPVATQGGNVAGLTDEALAGLRAAGYTDEAIEALRHAACRAAADHANI